ncbi:putative FAD-linked oxidoreductase [Planctomycetes bacterium Poly30]|uniref:Putative FAD-linked oxidoreductase n=1 Tax=Saltatorellus ferox TaxID=2528018 RepID=A0A518EXM4_9BACT|nr:putative FAD-linked oxidoreductase [Planctomycetes bacterium Poly30]
MTTSSFLDTAVEVAEIEIHGTSSPVALPRTEAELMALLADLRRAREAGSDFRAAFLGRGSAIGWCAPSLAGSFSGGSSSGEAANNGRATVWISTRSLVPDGATGIVEYVPGDGTLTAQAGASIETLRAAVREGGHRITPAGPRSGSTLGGILASGISSVDRYAFGPARHHVLGMRIQDASGRGPTRTGGRLVKNVTGFDLHRLHAGARGTLGAILEASLRLAPVPEAEVHVTSTPFSSAAEATAAGLELRASRMLQPRALFVRDRILHLVLGGRARQVHVELTAALEHLDAAAPHHGEDALDRAVDAARRKSALIIATAPSEVMTVVEHIERALPGSAAGLHIEPDAALVEMDSEGLRASLHGLFESVLPALDPSAVHVSLRDPSADFAQLRDVLRDRHVAPRAASEWMRRLQSSFDPAGVLRSPDFPPQEVPAS